ncbi:MAG: glycosyltransferase [Candidatus Nezhaarchaeales archaeon]
MGGSVKGLIVAGYGGHAAYAFAVAKEIVKLDVKLTILLPKGYEYLAPKFKGLGRLSFITLPRKPLEPFYKSLLRWPLSFIQSLEKLFEKYDFVFATGSNFSIPPSITQFFMKRIPIFVLEDVNRFSSKAKAVSVIQKMGGYVLLHWKEQLQLYPRGIVTGPVYEPLMYQSRDEGYVLVTLGTLGSKEVFDAVVNLDLEKAVVQTGDINPLRYARRKPKWTFFNYHPDLHRWISNASVVITHPGTTAVTARLAYKKPVVLVYTKRHSMLYPRRDVELLARKLNATFLGNVNKESLIESLEDAKKLSVPKYPQGSLSIAKILSSIVNE